jgi:hypothetical protein
LSATRRRFETPTVAEPLTLAVEESKYLPEVRVRGPHTTQREPAAVTPTIADGQYVIEAPGEPHSGIWQFELTTREGKPETRMIAVNVPAGEGDLHLFPRASLDEALRGIDYEFSLASQFTDSAEQLEGSRLADAMLYALIAALVLEQLLAVSASYHVNAQRKAA